MRPPLDDERLREWIVDNIKRDGGTTRRAVETRSIERRVATAEAPPAGAAGASARTAAETTRVVGIVAPFGDVADLGAFTEEYAPEAFRDQEKRGWQGTPTVLGLWSHNIDHPLASVQGDTLKLNTTRAGVGYEMYPVTEGIGAYALKLVGRGDVTGSSAGFYVLQEMWELHEDQDGYQIGHRTILSAVLREASLTPWPAYPKATAEPRSITTTDLERWRRRYSTDRTEGVDTLAARRQLDLLGRRWRGPHNTTKRRCGSA